MNKKILLAMALASTLLYGEEIPQIVDLGEYPTDYSIPESDAFNNAPELGNYLVSLAKKHGINVAIETGTWLGDTSIFLSDYFEEVITVELSDQYFLSAINRFQHHPNIYLYYGSSEKVLHRVLPSLTGQPVFFYLDAHWYNQWPLLDELEEIASTHKDNCLLVIDDFKVPERPEIPYDAYGPNECSFDYIQEKLDKIFTEYTFFYLIPQKIHSRAKFVAYPKSWESMKRGA